MDVRWISASGVELCGWADVQSCDEETANTLAQQFGFHALAVRDILERSHLPKIHAYPDHLFVVLHALEPGDVGQTHLIELDQFIGRRYLVTTHGPVAAGVPMDLVLNE